MKGKCESFATAEDSNVERRLRLGAKPQATFEGGEKGRKTS